MTQKTYIRVYEQEGASGDLQFNHDELDDFIRQLLIIRKRVPIEHRAGVTISITGSNYNPNVEIYYYRPETNAERIQRETKEAVHQANERARKRAQLEKLKRELGES